MYLCLQVTNGCQQDAIEAAHGRTCPDELHWCEWGQWGQWGSNVHAIEYRQMKKHERDELLEPRQRDAEGKPAMRGARFWSIHE